MTTHDRAVDAVQNEIPLLAQEIGIPPYGAQFKELVFKVTRAVEFALETGDESFKNVQRLVDREKRLAKTSRRHKPHPVPEV